MVDPIDAKKILKSAKKRTAKLDFNAGKHVFARILELVPPIDQNNCQSAKKRTANTVKQVSKLVNEFFNSILATVYPIDAKLPPKWKKRTVNAVKMVSRPANKHFRPYLCNGTSNWRKKLPKYNKKNGECCKNGFKAGEHIFSPRSWQHYLRSTHNNLQSAKKEHWMP